MTQKMKFLFLLVAISTMSASAQTTKPFIVDSGFGSFVLNADKDSFRNHIRFADSLTFEGVTDYFYVYSFNPPYEIDGIQFLDVLLTFDKSNKLTQIELSKIYTNHKDRALSDQNALNKFLTAQAGRKGKKKTKFNSLDASGYEWTKGNVLIWAYLQTTKAIKQETIEHYSISLVWKHRETAK